MLEKLFFSISKGRKEGRKEREGIPEGKERDKGAERLFKEIMAENFPIIGKETDIHIKKFQRFQIR